MPAEPRPAARIRSDIADVERYLAEVPPHSASAEDLQETLVRLRAELRRAEASGR